MKRMAKRHSEQEVDQIEPEAAVTHPEEIRLEAPADNQRQADGASRHP
jgi:hypothetical protein